MWLSMHTRCTLDWALGQRHVVISSDLWVDYTLLLLIRSVQAVSAKGTRTLEEPEQKLQY